MRTKQEIRHLLSQVHVGTFTKTDADIYFDTAKGTFYVSVIDGAGNRKNPMKDVRTIDDLLQKYRNQWQWTPQGKKFFADEI
jgi:hypothetical protein